MCVSSLHVVSVNFFTELPRLHDLTLAIQEDDAMTTKKANGSFNVATMLVYLSLHDSKCNTMAKVSFPDLKVEFKMQKGHALMGSNLNIESKVFRESIYTLSDERKEGRKSGFFAKLRNKSTQSITNLQFNLQGNKDTITNKIKNGTRSFKAAGNHQY
mmetsp:Transcript_2001/g.2729  ORF Transcript_2001/g.2729 Transcript_2001/m.2729 type:complete len:158 (-) Transcript_2001:268-741(-)